MRMTSSRGYFLIEMKIMIISLSTKTLMESFNNSLPRIAILDRLELRS